MVLKSDFLSARKVFLLVVLTVLCVVHTAVGFELSPNQHDAKADTDYFNDAYYRRYPKARYAIDHTDTDRRRTWNPPSSKQQWWDSGSRATDRTGGRSPVAGTADRIQQNSRTHAQKHSRGHGGQATGFTWPTLQPQTPVTTYGSSSSYNNNYNNNNNNHNSKNYYDTRKHPSTNNSPYSPTVSIPTGHKSNTASRHPHRHSGSHTSRSRSRTSSYHVGKDRVKSSSGYHNKHYHIPKRSYQTETNRIPEQDPNLGNNKISNQSPQVGNNWISKPGSHKEKKRVQEPNKNFGNNRIPKPSYETGGNRILTSSGINPKTNRISTTNYNSASHGISWKNEIYLPTTDVNRVPTTVGQKSSSSARGEFSQYWRSCPDCYTSKERRHCPLRGHARKLKRSTVELTKVLSFGCPDQDGDGDCCPHGKGRLEMEIAELNRRINRLSRELKNNCRGCEAKTAHWSSWGSWGSCSATCGSGMRQRHRRCEKTNWNYVEDACPGRSVDTEPCRGLPSCGCVDREWTPWSSWSACSASCGSGVQERSRSCSDRGPDGCGRKCRGASREVQQCTTDKGCCENASWTSWSQWSACSASCGQGVQEKTRMCGQMSSGYTNCGGQCPGLDTLQQSCMSTGQCCEKRNWSNWESWSACSATCGKASRSRSRSCDITQEGNDCGQSLCVGQDKEEEDCVGTPKCLNVAWSEWGPCSVTCRGVGTRERSWVMKSDSNLGSPETRQFQVETCRVFEPECEEANEELPSWGAWESPTTCDCRSGRRWQKRRCFRHGTISVPTRLCPGEERINEKCDVRKSCPVCRRSCDGAKDGVYPSCTNCEHYLKCKGGSAQLYACSQIGSAWDAFVEKCVSAPSPSCSVVDPVRSCAGTPDGQYPSELGCDVYVQCRRGTYSRFRCPGTDTEWNQLTQECEAGQSPTCRWNPSYEGPTVPSGRSVAKLDLRSEIIDAPASEYYDETTGLTPRERRERYEEKRKRKERRNYAGRDTDFTGYRPRTPAKRGCVRSCVNVDPGTHPSCRDCSHYVLCSRYGQMEERRCPREYQYDALWRTCVRRSRTCR